MNKNLSNLVLILFFVFVCTQAFGIGNLNAPKGGILYRHLNGEPENLNPINASDLNSLIIQQNVVESLLSHNIQSNEWEESLAVDYNISDNLRVFTFKIRDGVKWHDGYPLTVEDVKFSFDVLFDLNLSADFKRSYYENIEAAEILDDKTVRFLVKRPNFKNFDIVAGLQILPKHIYEVQGQKLKIKTKKILVGTGPYMLEGFDKGEKITLKLNEDWWGKGEKENQSKFNFSKIVFLFVENENASFELFKKGTIDFRSLSEEEFMRQTPNEKWDIDIFKVKVENLAPKNSSFIAWNLKNPLFEDKKVRMALSHLMNRKLMNEKFNYNLDLLASGPWYLQSEYADPEVKTNDFDPAKAMELFKSANWDDLDKDGILEKKINGKDLQMKFTILMANKQSEKYLTMYKEDAKKYGIDIQLKLLDWGTLMQLITVGNFEAIHIAWGGGAIDIDPKPIWHSESIVKGGLNYISYNNPEVDKLIDQTEITFDKKERVQILRKVYKLIAEDAPYLFMFNKKYGFYAHTKKIKKEVDTYQFDVGLDYWWAQE